MHYLNWEDIIFHPDVEKKKINILRQKKGYAFELLVFHLLKCLYPDILFEITPRTNDGGKDIIPKFQDESTTAYKFDNFWVECKNHEQNLGINQISNTLVMALIDTIDTIIIFSKSDVSASYFNKISKYIRKTNKKVITYAGEVLEQIIINNRENPNLSFDKFFKSGVLQNKSYMSLLDVYSISDKEQYLQKEKVYIKLFLKNQSAQKLNIKIDKSDGKYLKFINSDLLSNEFFLEPYEIKIVHYIYKISDYNNIIKLPVFTISSNNLHFKTNEKEISCEKILYSKYVGDGNNYLNEIDKLKNVQFCYPIIGKSGTGKSRLAKEMQDSFMQNQFDVFYIDLENENTDSMLKQILSFFYDLPYFIPPSGILTQNNEVANLIYSSKKISFSKCDTVINLILRKIYEKKIIFIDNFQLINRQMLYIFERLLFGEYQKESFLQRFVILFNQDYMQDEKIISFYGKVKKSYNHYEIKNLTKSLEFIYGSLGVEGSTNEQFFEKLAENCQYNPLYIQNILQLYLDNHIISIEAGNVIINENNIDDEVFYSSMDFKTLMVYREKIILDSLNHISKKYYNYIMTYLLYFKKIKYEHCLILIDGKTELINSLVSEGIIDCDGLEIRFFHNMLFESFYKIYYTDNNHLLSKGLSKKILEIIRDDTTFPYITAYYSIHKTLTKHLTKNLLKLYHHANYLTDDFSFLNFICKIAFSENNKWAKVDKVKMLYELSNAAVRMYGVKTSYKIVEPYIKIITSQKEYYAKGNEIIYYNTLRTHINKLILMNSNESAAKRLESFINDIEKEKKLFEIKSILYNRYSVVLSSLNKIDESIDWANKGLLEAKKEKSDRYIIENYVDLAYSYYFKNDKDNCLSNLENAIKQYKKSKKKTEFFYAKYYSYNSLYLLIKQDYKKYEDFTIDLKENLDKTNRQFYEINMRLGLCIYYTIQDYIHKNMNNLKDFNFYIKELDLLIIDYNSNRFRYKKEYILSNYTYYVEKNLKKASENYYKTLILFLNSVENIVNLEKYTILLCDLIRKLKDSSTDDKFMEYLESLNKYKEYIKNNLDSLLKNTNVSLLTDPDQCMVFPTI